MNCGCQSAEGRGTTVALNLVTSQSINNQSIYLSFNPAAFSDHQVFYHLPEEVSHVTAVLQHSPDEEMRPGGFTGIVPVRRIFLQQQLFSNLRREEQCYEEDMEAKL